jgi:DNA-binding MarR family transcriptional regulator
MTEPTQSDLANAIIQAYLQVGDATRFASLPGWLTADLTISQLKAIVLLASGGPLTISELARLLGMGNPAASILVQQLVEQGYIERYEDSQDRRRTYVRPTERGAGLLAGRREQIRTSLLGWLGQMDGADLAALQQGLEALIRVIPAERTPAGS